MSKLNDFLNKNLRDDDYDKLTSILKINEYESGQYICRYEIVISRIKLVLDHPNFNSYSQKSKDSFISWLCKVGRRRSDLNFALNHCSIIMDRDKFSLDAVNHIGLILFHHYFNEINSDMALYILNCIYKWSMSSNLEECLKKLDELSETNCKVLKVRALVVICDTIANS